MFGVRRALEKRNASVGRRSTVLATANLAWTWFSDQSEAHIHAHVLVRMLSPVFEQEGVGALKNLALHRALRSDHPHTPMLQELKPSEEATAEGHTAQIVARTGEKNIVLFIDLVVTENHQTLRGHREDIGDVVTTHVVHAGRNSL